MKTEGSRRQIRITVDIPDEILRQVKEATGETTTAGAVTAALEEFVRFSPPDSNESPNA